SHPVRRLYVEANTRLPANERIPDISFVAAERIPPTGSPLGVWQIAPDLAIEIISPNDLHERVNTKVLEYLDAGVKQVWVVSLEQRMVTIHPSPNESHTVRGEAELTGGDLLPGFRCKLSEIFPAAVAA
ncbi:MAG: Uma2 family endonuclease, partial [Acidobacteria bacterium]|nr:Uma2 family endonuclease [Acidobacteriota bacterium]